MEVFILHSVRGYLMMHTFITGYEFVSLHEMIESTLWNTATVHVITDVFPYPLSELAGMVGINMTILPLYINITSL